MMSSVVANAFLSSSFGYHSVLHYIDIDVTLLTRILT